MIAIVDYGSGNVGAIENLLRRRRIPHMLTAKPAELSIADRFILPGVGAFDPTMETLQRAGIVEALNEEVLGKGKAVLGICVGMHLMAESSDEGDLPGLGWIPGHVRRIDESLLKEPPKLPHMGWNSITAREGASLFVDIDKSRGFYFLHSFYFDATDPDHVSAYALYGKNLPCAVERENIFGTQFHPEKSHANGMQLFANFAALK